MGLTLLQNDLSIALKSDASSSAAATPAASRGSDNDKNSIGEEASKKKEQATATDDNCVLVLKKEDVQEWMSLSTQVFQNAEAAVGVLSDLLNYDKIQMGNLTLELSLINIWSLLEATVKEFQLSALEKNVTLAIDFSPLLSEGSAEEPSNTSKGCDGNRLVNAKSKNGLIIEGGDGSVTSTNEEHHTKSLTQNGESDGNMTAKDLPVNVYNCKVVGDKVRLVQVFRNLLSNGLKFSKENSKMTVRVSLTSIPERKQKPEQITLHKGVPADVTKVGFVSIQVIDEGVGMTQEQVDTVFEDGTQFDANKLQAGGGSGLGLNIARGIVIEHGGSLTCSSKGIGKGTTFTLSTSLYFDNSSSSASAAMEHQDNTPAKRKSTYSRADLVSACLSAKEVLADEENAVEDYSIPAFHILVVDDATMNRKLCMRLLERQGHTVDGASDGKEAVDMVKKSFKTGELYDCILLDHEMPIMKGPDACKIIRKMGCSAYICGVTGNVLSEDVEHFRKCGANWVMPKPFRLKALEDQWAEDAVTPCARSEQQIRKLSSQALIEMVDKLTQNTGDSQSNEKAAENSLW